jgi:hypothetical protein
VLFALDFFFGVGCIGFCCIALAGLSGGDTTMYIGVALICVSAAANTAMGIVLKRRAVALRAEREKLRDVAERAALARRISSPGGE